MSGSQFWRLFLILNLLAVAITGFLVRRDFETIYENRQYAYDPWTALLLSRGLAPEVAEKLAVQEVKPDYQDYVLRTYRSNGYRACPMGADDYLDVCFERDIGFGKMGVIFPADGSIEDLKTMTFPALVKGAGGEIEVVARPAYDANGNSKEVHEAIARISSRAESRYRAAVRRELGDRLPLWLLVGLGPGMLMLILFGGYRWVRFGSLKGEALTSVHREEAVERLHDNGNIN